MRTEWFILNHRNAWNKRLFSLSNCNFADIMKKSTKKKNAEIIQLNYIFRPTSMYSNIQKKLCCIINSILNSFFYNGVIVRFQIKNYHYDYNKKNPFEKNVSDHWKDEPLRFLDLYSILLMTTLCYDHWFYVVHCVRMCAPWIRPYAKPLEQVFASLGLRRTVKFMDL